MTKAVLIHEEFDDIAEIDIDIDPVKNQIFKVLQGPATFIGQWPELDVVIMKCVRGGDPWAERERNANLLPPPFQRERVLGKILLMRMDADSEPQDFTLNEYNDFILQKSLE